MKKEKPNLFWYRVTQVLAGTVSTVVFRRKLLRNEIRGKKGPFVVIANHQAALDFVNLIGATHVPMTFVISDSFYNTLPFKGIMNRLGVIPKQQFRTTITDIKRMKATVESGQILVLYPAGLMCEDGLSTPIPEATYQFLKWLGVDVYVAKTRGTYFAMPKWAHGMRPGRTYLDIYRLFSAEELAAADEKTVREKAEEALLFDAYREQEKLLVEYRDNDNIEGLENVLYMCPHCGTEFSVRVKDRSTIYCAACGYEEQSDRYAFLHHRGDVGSELRYVSDWSRLIYERLRERMWNGDETSLSAETDFQMVDPKRNKFVKVGHGCISLTEEGFALHGQINGEDIHLSVPLGGFASLPFSPGKHLEIQHGGNIYRCALKDGRAVMKFVNMVKIYYELNNLPSPVRGC